MQVLCLLSYILKNGPNETISQVCNTVQKRTNDYEVNTSTLENPKISPLVTLMSVH